MTDELIELEYAHIELDRKLKNGNEQYEDEDYEKYDEETDETDRMLSYDVPASHASEANTTPSVRVEGIEDEWEEVEDDETFDFD